MPVKIPVESKVLWVATLLPDLIGCHYGIILIKHLTYKTTVRTFLQLSLLLIIFIFNCSPDSQPRLVPISVTLRTSDNQLQSNFDSCLRLTQQLIKTQSSNKEFSQFFSFNRMATGFEYDNIVFIVLDTLSKIPKSYQIYYDFIFKGDTISSFRADFDSTLKMIGCRSFHLTAFRKFIDNELTVTKSMATNIAVRNGMKEEGLDPILKCSGEKIYWICKNDCNGCIYFDIDAKSGDIIEQGKVIYQY
jgi:hypothetical protein